MPPAPALEFNEDLRARLERASRALGRLDGVARLLPDPRLLIYTYIRKEAVLSSQIEGTQSSLSDLLLYENKQTPGVPLSDVQEVSNYVRALEHGLKRMRGGFPLSIRLIKEVHAELTRGARGSEKEPGELRRSQNWIGGSRPGNAVYVPPPANLVPASLGALEKFLHDDPVSTPALVKSGLAHAQFESIHPFLDGNGRVGRLLIPLILHVEGVLSYPLLYLSLYFKLHRTEYYDALQRVRLDGRWEDWLAFYLNGVEEVALQASDTAERLTRMFAADRAKILGLGRGAASALKVHGLLERRCVIAVPIAQKELNLSFPTVSLALSRLQELGLVKEISGRRRDRVFAYEPYRKLISQGL